MTYHRPDSPDNCSLFQRVAVGDVGEELTHFLQSGFANVGTVSLVPFAKAQGSTPRAGQSELYVQSQINLKKTEINNSHVWKNR